MNLRGIVNRITGSRPAPPPGAHQLPTYTVHRAGHGYEIHSDAPAAAPTGGRVLSGLDRAATGSIVERLRLRCVVHGWED